MDNTIKTRALEVIDDFIGDDVGADDMLIMKNVGVFADAVARDVADDWKSWFINVDEHKRNMLYQLVFDTIKERVGKYDESEV